MISSHPSHHNQLEFTACAQNFNHRNSYQIPLLKHNAPLDRTKLMNTTKTTNSKPEQCKSCLAFAIISPVNYIITDQTGVIVRQKFGKNEHVVIHCEVAPPQTLGGKTALDCASRYRYTTSSREHTSTNVGQFFGLKRTCLFMLPRLK